MPELDEMRFTRGIVGQVLIGMPSESSGRRDKTRLAPHLYCGVESSLALTLFGRVSAVPLFCGQFGKPLSCGRAPPARQPSPSKSASNACGTVHYHPRVWWLRRRFESQLVLCQRAMAPAKPLVSTLGFIELDEALEVAQRASCTRRNGV